MPGLLLAVFLALVSLSTATAADLVLGPESPMTPPSTTPAPFEQHLAGVASNGRDYLAIWFDRRATVPSLPYGSGMPRLYASRLDSAGRPATPFGIEITDAVYNRALVRTSSAYVVLWSTGSEVDLMLLDDDGNPATAPKRLTDGYLTRAASNGRTMFLIHGQISGGMHASVYTADGTLLSDVALDPTNHYPDAMRVFAMPDGSYGFVAQTWTCPGQVPCVVEPTLTTISESGQVKTKPLGPVEQATQSAAAFGGGRLLLAWLSESASGRSVGYRLYDANGNAIMVDRKIIIATKNISSISGQFSPAVGWDGRQFVVAWQWPTAPAEQSGEIRAVRISADGAQLDPSPFLFSNTLGRPPWFVSNGTDNLVLWDTAAYQSSDIAVRALPSFDALDSAPTRVIPESSALQRDVRIAANGSSRMAVWREGDPVPSIVAATAAGQPVLISAGATLDHQAPAIGANRDEYLVVWREAPLYFTGAPPPFRILGKRVRADGTPLDGDPIVISIEASAYSFSSADTLAVASDGSDFLVVWIGTSDRLHAARVTAAGAVLDSPPIEVTAYATPSSPRAVWNGSRYVVAWIADPSCKVCLFPPVGPPTLFLDSVEIDRGGKTSATSSIASGSFGSHLGLASGPDGLMAAWAVSPDNRSLCLSAMALHADGTPAAPMRSIKCTQSTYPEPFPDVDVAWDGGGSYVIAWAETVSPTATTARAIRVGGDGSPRDAAPFEISPAVRSSFQPALASTADGIIVAYGRIADEPQYGGVARLFVRTLAPTAPLFRRRATR